MSDNTLDVPRAGAAVTAAQVNLAQGEQWGIVLGAAAPSAAMHLPGSGAGQRAGVGSLLGGGIFSPRLSASALPAAPSRHGPVASFPWASVSQLLGECPVTA